MATKTVTIHHQVIGPDDAFVTAEDTVQWLEQTIEFGLERAADQTARNALASARALRAWLRKQAEKRAVS